MSWEPLWDDIFGSREWGKYPPEPLIRYMAQNYYSSPDRSKIRVLDLGCGPGSGPGWYLAREGFEYYGIDGSKVAIARAKEKFQGEGLRGTFMVGDVSALPWESGYFDCVVDLVCLMCNSEKETAKIISEIHRVLKPEGQHFSLTAADNSWGEGTGAVVDKSTFADLTEGPFARMGRIRFSSEASLRQLYHEFKNISFGLATYKQHNWPKPVRHHILACKK